jgi:hypothetical protein
MQVPLGHASREEPPASHDHAHLPELEGVWGACCTGEPTRQNREGVVGEFSGCGVLPRWELFPAACRKPKLPVAGLHLMACCAQLSVLTSACAATPRCTHPLADEDRERGVYVGGEGVGGGLSTGAEATGGDIVDDEVVGGG